MRHWLIALLLLGCAPRVSDDSPPPVPPRTPSGTPASTPLATPNPVATFHPAREAAVLQALKTQGQKFPGQAGLAFLDLKTGRTSGFRDQEVFESASLVKLPILVELHQRAQKGEISLEEEMVFEERFRVGGSGRIQNQPAGTKWKLRELARLMIAESDNVATDMLLERLGMEEIEASMRALGLKKTTVQRTIFDFGAIEGGLDNRTSAADVLLLLKGIATGSYPGAAEMRSALEGQKRNDMLPAKLPAGVKVAHKTGELDGVLHDAGIVGDDYVLVMLGQGFPVREDALAHWAETSLKVYQAYQTEGDSAPIVDPGVTPGLNPLPQE